MRIPSRHIVVAALARWRIEAIALASRKHSVSLECRGIGVAARPRRQPGVYDRSSAEGNRPAKPAVQIRRILPGTTDRDHTHSQGRDWAYPRAGVSRPLSDDAG